MKKLKASPFVMFFVFFILANSAQYAVNRVNIEDVEYLKGTDFVQLRFVTDKIISIPDVFYPDEGNPKRLIMRIGDVMFNISKDSFQFDSQVIDSVTFSTKNNFTDVEITLRERVNYRVFTNRNGLYIEFPNIKRTAAAPQYAPIRQKPVPVNVSRKGIDSAGLNSIKDIRITEKNADNIRVEFVLANAVNYNVIPIHDPPVRLAIDLKNTRSRRLKRAINHLNVKSLRGDCNTSSVFRIVFDLFYLKSYSVSLKKNVLEVEFFSANSLAQKRKEPEKKTEVEKKIPLKKAIKTTPDEDNTRQEIKVNPVEEVKPRIVITNSDIEKSEFFSEEKSIVAGGQAQDLESDPPQAVIQASSLFQNKVIRDGKKEWKGALRSYHLKDQDLVNLLIHFARDTGISMVFDPNISGTVTAELNQVPWDQALDIFLRQNGLGMQHEGNVIRIATISRLTKESKDRRQLQESRESEAELDTRTRVLSYAKASEVKSILDKSLTTRGNIEVDQRSNTLIITEVPDNFVILDGLIAAVDTATPQVSIEARIIETNSNYSKNLGVQWGYRFMADSAYGNQTSMKFPNSIGALGNQLDSRILPAIGPLAGYAVNLPAPGATSAATFTLGNVSNTFRLDMAISAMQRKGKGRIIQAPRFVTQNNVEATIKQGYSIPIQILQNNTIQVQYKEAVLSLTVKPTITADDSITMEINITNDNVDWGNYVDKFPALLTQSAETTIKAKNGETIVIGGMYKIETGTTKNSVPLLYKLPLLGNLFKSKIKSTQSRETLIFITPRIVR